MYQVKQNKFSKQITFEVIDTTDGEVMKEFKVIGTGEAAILEAKQRAESYANYQNKINA